MSPNGGAESRLWAAADGRGQEPDRRPWRTMPMRYQAIGESDRFLLKFKSPQFKNLLPRVEVATDRARVP